MAVVSGTNPLPVQQGPARSTHPEAVRSTARRAYLRKYQLKWIAARRERWIAENGPCQRCGSDNNLQIDHKDRNTKAVNPTKLWSLSRTKRTAELNKCQVLCADCHKLKTGPELAEISKIRIRQHPRSADGRLLPLQGASL